MKAQKNSSRQGTQPVRGFILSGLLVLLIFLVGSGLLFLKFNWFSLTMEEMLFHIKVSLRGAESGIVTRYLLWSVLPSILMTALYLVIRYLATLRKKFRLVQRIFLGVSWAFCLFSLVYAAFSFHFGTFLHGQLVSSDFIDTHYTDPADVRLEFPEKKRNVIYIYLESMEMTYADKKNGGDFPKNVIPELTALAEENEDFSGDSTQLNGGISLEDTTWTMGAMFGQTSGLPLKIPMGQNQMVYADTFFPGVTTFGDILEKQGYRNVLMLGSDASFGGRRKYFTQHGHYEICDWPWAKKQGLIPEDYKVWWGYEDQKLFQYARNKLEELARGDQPFNLTLLTVDTHFEDGHLCPLCPRDFGDNRYANIMHCSSRQVLNFVRWVQAQDFYDNTTIIISGDHPTMDTNFCDDVDENYQRKVYTCYINAAVQPEDPDRKRTYSTMDDFPTSLAALGVKIPGNRLGLGTNLFSKEKTLTEQYGASHINREISCKSALMKKLYEGR